MVRQEDFEEAEETEETSEVKPGQVDRGRYPGDILKDKKSGKKGTFVNEYGTNGKAIIVIPLGQKRSELWDAQNVDIIKKVKRPEQSPVFPQKAPVDAEEDYLEDEENLPEEEETEEEDEV